ncbi:MULTISPECIES: hypothetical protein [Caproicibacterium]|uniref:Uncharacterized protein n=1 Tax=Caproicibacterium argilliputei TaxID=3030016 RepID=A0AA97H178_9FIRM|nr:hypothetical protein [Caproicibacterium argilliputei]WOC31082.1 hypothetical protein PXC00_07510 [Caproicibacterium argilliputei]
MDNPLYAGQYPFLYSRFFNSTPDLQDYFLALPEDTQRAILSRDIQNEDEFRDCIMEYKLRE